MAEQWAFVERVTAALEQNREKQLKEIDALKEETLEDEEINRLGEGMVASLEKMQERADKKSEQINEIQDHRTRFLTRLDSLATTTHQVRLDRTKESFGVLVNGAHLILVDLGKLYKFKKTDVRRGRRLEYDNAHIIALLSNQERFIRGFLSALGQSEHVFTAVKNRPELTSAREGQEVAVTLAEIEQEIQLCQTAEQEVSAEEELAKLTAAQSLHRLNEILREQYDQINSTTPTMGRVLNSMGQVKGNEPLIDKVVNILAEFLEFFTESVPQEQELITQLLDQMKKRRQITIALIQTLSALIEEIKRAQEEAVTEASAEAKQKGGIPCYVPKRLKYFTPKEIGKVRSKTRRDDINFLNSTLVKKGLESDMKLTIRSIESELCHHNYIDPNKPAEGSKRTNVLTQMRIDSLRRFYVDMMKMRFESSKLRVCDAIAILEFLTNPNNASLFESENPLIFESESLRIEDSSADYLSAARFYRTTIINRKKRFVNYVKKSAKKRAAA